MGKYTQFAWLKSVGTRLKPAVFLLRLEPRSCFLTSASMATDMCHRCVEEEATNRGRCTKCHATESRIRILLKGYIPRVIPSNRPTFAQQWKSFSNSNIGKASFYVRAKTSFGFDLYKLMVETLEEEEEHKYNDRKSTLARKLSERFGDIESIDDTEYKGNFWIREEHMSKKAGTEMVICRSKKVKVERSDPVFKHCIPHTLTDGEKQTLTEHIEAAPKQVALLQGMKDDLEKIDSTLGFVPPHMVPRIEILSERIEHQVAIWGRNIQHGDCNMKLAKVLWREILKSVKECLRSSQRFRKAMSARVRA